MFSLGQRIEWQDFLRDHRVPAGRVRSMDDALADPQLAARGVLQMVAAPLGREGECEVPVAPFLMSEGNPAVDRAPPLLGQHSDEILDQIGFSRERIEKMYAEGMAAWSARPTTSR